jgi:hypothetical protein
VARLATDDPQAITGKRLKGTSLNFPALASGQPAPAKALTVTASRQYGRGRWICRSDLGWIVESGDRIKPNRCQMSKIGRAFHWILTIGNGLLCLAGLATGNIVSAAVSGVLAGILAWQLTW